MPKRYPTLAVYLSASFKVVTVRCQFHHFAHVARYGHLTVITKPLNRFTDRKRVINPFPAMPRTTERAAIRCTALIQIAGFQHDSGRCGVCSMSMQSSKTLEQYVGRYRVGRK